MARPQKDTVDYFPLYCKEGKTMYFVEQKYGNDGFATWIKLLQILCQTNYHYLDLKKAQDRMFLSAKCKVSEERLEEIIQDLCQLGEFDSELWESFRVVWCQKLIDSIQDAYKKRTNECITRNQVFSIFGGVNPESGDVNTQRKEKDNKEDNTTEKESSYSEQVQKVFSSVEELFPERFRPKTKVQLSKWLDTIDKLNRLDGYSFSDIVFVVKWARQDNFWSENFLSIEKLRKKSQSTGGKYFDMFYLKACPGQKAKPENSKKGASDFFEKK